eukprot:1777999-Prymnesium_polylepis.1
MSEATDVRANDEDAAGEKVTERCGTRLERGVAVLCCVSERPSVETEHAPTGRWRALPLTMILRESASGEAL